MTRSTCVRWCVVLLFVAAFVGLTEAVSAQSDIAGRLERLINQQRLAKGLPPYGLNANLSQAAQAHSDDLARNGVSLGHIGSDGSTPLQRIDRSGYPRAGGWGGEIWAWANSPEAAYADYWQDAAHLDMIFNPVSREMGIGVTPVQYGYIMVVDFGASPNVLPIIINDGAASTHDRLVTLTLTNENAIPYGDGPNRMGLAVNVQISSRNDFANVPSQPYAPKISFTLPNSAGMQTVFVKFTDGQGRATTSSTAISLILPATAVPTASMTPTASPSATRTRTPTPTSTLTRTSTPTATATPTITDTPTGSPTNSPTLEPTLPTATPTPTPTGSLLSGTAASANLAADPVPNNSLPLFASLIVVLFVLALILAACGRT